jgi:hypothetical protein
MLANTAKKAQYQQRSSPFKTNQSVLYISDTARTRWRSESSVRKRHGCQKIELFCGGSFCGSAFVVASARATKSRDGQRSMKVDLFGIVLSRLSRRVIFVPSFWYIIWFPRKTNFFGATVIRFVFSTIAINVYVVGYHPVANFLSFVVIFWVILVLPVITGQYRPIGIAPMDRNRHHDKRQ